MPRDGAYWLQEWPHDLIKLACLKCGRHGQYAKAKLLARYGDVPMTELVDRIIRDSERPCEKLQPGRTHDRCGAVYDYTKEEWAFWWERHAEILSGKATET